MTTCNHHERFGQLTERCACPVEGCPKTISANRAAVLNHISAQHPGISTRERSLLADKALKGASE